MLKALAVSIMLAGSLTLSAAAQPPKPADPAKPSTPATPTTPAQPKTPDAPKSPDAPKALDVLGTVAATGNHTTFVSLVKAAGIEGDLKTGQFTVFAPTDDAFKKVSAAKLDALKKPENKAKLAALLKFHVLKGKVMAADLTKKTESDKTLEGHTFKIESKDGKVMVGTGPKSMAQVTKADVAASNGVVHVIDGVMMPDDAHDHDVPKTPPAAPKSK